MMFDLLGVTRTDARCNSTVGIFSLECPCVVCSRAAGFIIIDATWKFKTIVTLDCTLLGVLFCVPVTHEAAIPRSITPSQVAALFLDCTGRSPDKKKLLSVMYYLGI